MTENHKKLRKKIEEINLPIILSALREELLEKNYELISQKYIYHSKQYMNKQFGISKFNKVI